MKSETIRQLNQLNQEFYATVAESFDQTRQQPWTGWKLLVPAIQQLVDQKKGHLSVLDLGCGNGRFGEFLTHQFPELEISYTGIDNNQTLLDFANQKLNGKLTKLQLIKVDLVKSLPSDNFPSSVINQKFDLVVAFGVLHHIPAFQLRKKFIHLVPKFLTAGGLFIFSSWQFDQDQRIMSRAASISTQLNQLAADLEVNDFFLDWKRGSVAVRYCHLVDENEVQALLKSSFKQVTSFVADGPGNQANRYYITNLSITAPAK